MFVEIVKSSDQGKLIRMGASGSKSLTQTVLYKVIDSLFDYHFEVRGLERFTLQASSPLPEHQRLVAIESIIEEHVTNRRGKEDEKNRKRNRFQCP